MPSASDIKAGGAFVELFTKNGKLALGRNLRVAYIPYKGYNFEDGVVISESGAQALRSVHMHKPSIRPQEGDISDPKKFQIQHPESYKKDQYENLLDKAEEKLNEPLEYKSFFQEMKESVTELRNESLLILQSLPPYLDFSKLRGKDLIEINSQYRTINHFLIELTDEVAEFENLLRNNNENNFVRYVTKYKKDIANLISYFNIKINGSLSVKISQFKSRH